MPKIMKKMNIISRCQAMYRNERAASEELSACHSAFVLTVCRAPGLSQEELAREICLNKSTVTRTLSYLEEHGFVERRSDAQDKRVLLVYPTEKMLSVLPRVREVTREWNALISRGIDEEEMRVFFSVLERMERSAKAAVSAGEEQKK